MITTTEQLSLLRLQQVEKFNPFDLRKLVALIARIVAALLRPFAVLARILSDKDEPLVENLKATAVESIEGQSQDEGQLLRSESNGAGIYAELSGLPTDVHAAVGMLKGLLLPLLSGDISLADLEKNIEPLMADLGDQTARLLRGAQLADHLFQDFATRLVPAVSSSLAEVEQKLLKALADPTWERTEDRTLFRALNLLAAREKTTRAAERHLGAAVGLIGSGLASDDAQKLFLESATSRFASSTLSKDFPIEVVLNKAVEHAQLQRIMVDIEDDEEGPRYSGT